MVRLKINPLGFKRLQIKQKKITESFRIST